MNLFGHNVIALMASYGYLLVLIVVLIEEAGVPLPLPSDLLLLFAGSLVARGTLSFAPTMGVVVIATLIGTSVLYSLARHGGRPLVRRYGHWLRIKDEHLTRAECWLGRRPVSGLVLLRLIPGLRVYSTIASGVLAVPRLRAMAAFVVSGAIWATAWVGLGLLLGSQVTFVAQRLSRIDRLFGPLLIIVAALVVTLIFVRFVYHRYFRGHCGSIHQVAHAMGTSLWSRRRPLSIGLIGLAFLLVLVPAVGFANPARDHVVQDPDLHNIIIYGHRVTSYYDHVEDQLF